MAKNKLERDSIPDGFNSFDELANFWETHDLADYSDLLHEVQAEVTRMPTRHFVLTLSDE